MFTAKRLGSVLIAIGGALLGTLALSQQEDKPRKIAVLVGVKGYNHADLPDLEFTENDVEELGDLLWKAGYEVRLLTTSAGKTNAQSKPTLTNIRRELDAALKTVTKRDTVLIGLAGHGIQPDGAKSSYFCPTDARPKDTATLLSLGGLIDQLNDSGVGVKLLLVDACRNDPDPARGRGVDGSRIEGLPNGVAALFSCSEGQRSFETKKAGKGHGVFFHFVIEGLNGKAADPETGEIDWNSLTGYVQRNVEKGVATWVSAEVRQEPHEVKNLRGKPPVLLTMKVTASAERPDKGVTTPDLGKTEEAKDFENSIGAKMVYIKPGTFQMGSPENEHGRRDDEKQHPVALTKGYYLGATVVTQKQWQSVMGNNPSWFKGDDLPVENVSWEEAKEFCKKLSAKEGRTYRLPYEAEWEYACRAGTKAPFWTGETITTDQANFDGNYPYRDSDVKGQYREKTTPVTMFKANAWALYDMHGNVLQWCEDWYGADYYDKSEKNDPHGPAEGLYRVFRGGSWRDVAGGCRAAVRNWQAPAARYDAFGFRLALVPAR